MGARGGPAAAVNGSEHRSIGDAAFGGGLVDLGGDSAAESFRLSYGEVMAVSGDFFAVDDAAAGADGLFALARIPGRAGTRPGTRDEIVCALKVMSADEAVRDGRVEPGGEVERRVRDRYLELAATNDDHFVAPGGVTHAGRTRSFGSAVLAYRHLHERALDEAWRRGRAGGEPSHAFAREAAAQHFLTDAFTSGHMRTPVAQIRTFWRARYPAFWDNLQRRVGASTAATLRELAWALRSLPPHFLEQRTVAALRRRTSRYPELSLGDFLARLFHDWDNAHGLAIDGGAVVFGDGHVHHGDTRRLALAAVRAGIDDVEAAFALGAAGRAAPGEALYRAVRAATGADERFRAEALTPRPAPANPPQNWRAPDIETLWDAPMLGAGGITVGQALGAMLEPDGLFIRQLDRLGRGLVEPFGLLALPVVGRRLRDVGAHAYHRGFVQPLSADPERAILAVVHGDPAREDVRTAAHPTLSSYHRAEGHDIVS